MKTKAEIRKELKVLIGNLSPEEKKRQSAELCGRLLSHPVIRAAKTIGIYLPLPDEPDLRPALNILMQQGVQMALPFLKNGTAWHFHQISHFKKVAPGIWGLDFPDKGDPVDVSGIEVILVPGRGFTPEGHRIGRGKGLYDRLLRNHCGHRIGIGFSCQLLDALPVEPHDIPLTEVWTADG